ncbi:MAG TPA: pyrimidine 5'-nucleotidase [Burkholderiaceae bacterium]|nr:pyrimidine 5'-nucleotidase [Burkholderiaceae bacterium]
MNPGTGRRGRAPVTLSAMRKVRAPHKAAAGRRAAPVWLFDLDNTLHDASHAIFGAIDRRMTDYVERELGVERGEANRLRTLYWRRYGATLLGLVRHHGIDPHHFLRETHDFDVAELLRAERGLVRLFARLPGRKLLLTNAPLAYAGSVLRELSLHRHFRTRYSIERMRVHGTYRPKPSRLMLRSMLARERIRPSAAVLVEDSVTNLKAARSLGMRTVLITRHGASAARRSPAAVGLRISSLHELARRFPR